LSQNRDAIGFAAVSVRALGPFHRRAPREFPPPPGGGSSFRTAKVPLARSLPRLSRDVSGARGPEDPTA